MASKVRVARGSRIYVSGRSISWRLPCCGYQQKDEALDDPVSPTPAPLLLHHTEVSSLKEKEHHAHAALLRLLFDLRAASSHLPASSVGVDLAGLMLSMWVVRPLPPVDITHMLDEEEDEAVSPTQLPPLSTKERALAADLQAAEQVDELHRQLPVGVVLGLPGQKPARRNPGAGPPPEPRRRENQRRLREARQAAAARMPMLCRCLSSPKSLR